MRRLLIASVVGSVISFVSAGGMAICETSVAPQPLTVRSPAEDPVPRPHGQKFEAVLVVVNDSADPGRVLNLAPSCRGNCCFSSKLNGHVTVPPHSEVAYVVEITPTRAGPFEMETDLYVDDHGLRTVPVLVRGVAE